MASFHRKYNKSNIFDQIKIKDTSIPAEALVITPKSKECDPLSNSSTAEFNRVIEDSKSESDVDNSDIEVEHSINSLNDIVHNSFSSPEIARRDSGTSNDTPVLKSYRLRARHNDPKNPVVIETPEIKDSAEDSDDDPADSSVVAVDFHCNDKKMKKCRVFTSSRMANDEMPMSLNISSIKVDEDASGLHVHTPREMHSDFYSGEFDDTADESSVMTSDERSPQYAMFLKECTPLPDTIPSPNPVLMDKLKSAPVGACSRIAVNKKEDCGVAMTDSAKQKNAVSYHCIATPRPPRGLRRVIDTGDLPNFSRVANDVNLTIIADLSEPTSDILTGDTDFTEGETVDEASSSFDAIHKRSSSMRQITPRLKMDQQANTTTESTVTDLSNVRSDSGVVDAIGGIAASESSPEIPDQPGNVSSTPNTQPTVFQTLSGENQENIPSISVQSAVFGPSQVQMSEDILATQSFFNFSNIRQMINFTANDKSTQLSTSAQKSSVSNRRLEIKKTRRNDFHASQSSLCNVETEPINVQKRQNQVVVSSQPLEASNISNPLPQQPQELGWQRLIKNMHLSDTGEITNRSRRAKVQVQSSSTQTIPTVVYPIKPECEWSDISRVPQEVTDRILAHIFSVPIDPRSRVYDQE